MSRGATWLVAVAIAVLTVAPAGAQAPGDASGELTPSPLELTLTDLSGTLGPGAVRPPDPLPADRRAVPTPPVDLQLRAIVDHVGEGTLDELRIVVEVHEAASSRAGLRAALDRPGGLDTSRVVHVDNRLLRPDTEAAGELTAGETAGVEVTIARDDIPWAEDGGVHPVEVAIVRGTEVLASAATAVVWLAELPEEPLLTTAVWPLAVTPWRRAGPTYPAGADADVRRGGRLDGQLRAVERRPEVPVLLAPPAHLFEDLQDRADGFVRTERRDDGTVEARTVAPEDGAARRANAVLGRLRNALADAPTSPLARPYADADLSDLADGDDTQNLAGELARIGRLRLDALGERASDGRTYLLPAGIDDEVLDLVPADTVLVPYPAVEGPDPAGDPRLPSPVRETTSASGRPVTLVVGDPYLTALLDAPGDGGPVATTQRIVAETAMAYFQAPATPDRALAVHPPDAWAPSAEEAQRLLDRFGEATWLRLSAPSILAVRARRGPAADLRTPEAGGGSEVHRARLAEVADDLDAASAARTGEDTDDLAGRRPNELRDALWRSTSRWFPDGSPPASALVDDVEATIDEALDDVTIASGSLITLTSDTGTIPVTLQRSNGEPLAVQVEVASQSRLTWPEGRTSETIVLEDQATQTVSFPTRALSTGTFSVNVRVTDPTGRIELDRTTLSVRSTAISGPALSIIAGLVVVLLLAGLIRRRPKRRLEVVH